MNSVNQEQIGKRIKEIRIQNNMTQKEFADRYHVTYQAVSKWENAKSIPDITILKQICDDYHLDFTDFLEIKKRKEKNRMIEGIMICFIAIFLGLTIWFFLSMNQDHGFEFKTLSSNCGNFRLYGSIAYNNKKSSIYISNITYCGEVNHNKYQMIECTLYEADHKVKKEISKYQFKNKEEITLEQFLKKVNFHVDHYEKTCKLYQENSLYLEIEAIDQSGKIDIYKIPLKLKDNCI